MTISGNRLTAVPRDTCAWAGLVAYIAVAEALLTHGAHPLMSHSFDRWLDRPIGRLGCWLVVGATGAHLLNLLPDKIDPFHIAFWRICGLRGTPPGD